MKNLIRYFLVISLILLVAGCAGVTGKTAGQTVDDARINAEINSKFVRDPLLSAIRIDVDSFQGNVTLSGSVPSREAEQRAIALARETSGVKSTVSNLAINQPRELSQTAPPAAGLETRQDAQAIRFGETSRIVGMDVKNLQGEDLGNVREIIINYDTGQITYVIMEGDSAFLGAENRMFAIPWKSFTPSVSGNELVLDINRERLASAPFFTRGAAPNFTDRRWEGEIYRFYGVTPYWVEP
jgi:sporulation protein YlmC with PRC-barrel domain